MGPAPKRLRRIVHSLVDTGKMSRKHMDERDQTPEVDWAVDYSAATVGQLVAGRDHHAQLADGLGREHPTAVALAVYLASTLCIAMQ